MSKRIRKVNDFIKEHVSSIIKKDLSLKKGVFVSITKVDTSKDLNYTKIFVSIFPSEETDYALKTLQKEIYRIQKKFNQKFSARTFPRLRFVVDRTGEKVTELEELFQKIKKEKEKEKEK